MSCTKFQKVYFDKFIKLKRSLNASDMIVILTALERMVTHPASKRDELIEYEKLWTKIMGYSNID